MALMRNNFPKKIFALSNLAIQFVSHFLKKVFFWKKNGLVHFQNNYRSDGFLPLSAQDQSTFFSFSACLNCRFCDSACPALFKMSRERFPGPSIVLTAYSRSFKDLWASSLDLSLCQDCEECIKVCPNEINVKGAIHFIQNKVAEQIKFAARN